MGLYATYSINNLVYRKYTITRVQVQLYIFHIQHNKLWLKNLIYAARQNTGMYIIYTSPCVLRYTYMYMTYTSPCILRYTGMYMIYTSPCLLRYTGMYMIYTSPCVLRYTGMYMTYNSPCVRSVGCVFAHHYSLVDDSECPWTVSYFCYLKCFPLIIWTMIWLAKDGHMTLISLLLIMYHVTILNQSDPHIIKKN